MSKTPAEATQSMIQNLETDSGKSLAVWIALARAGRLTKHREILTYLKTTHGLTHGYANLVALKTIAPGGGKIQQGDPIAAQYAGGKSALRPIYDALVTVVRRFGTDVEISPKKAYVSLRRNQQFGIIQPTTKTRVDVGLVLKHVRPQGRLETAGSFNAMVTHRIRVEKRGDIDKELIEWLRRAYDAA